MDDESAVGMSIFDTRGVKLIPPPKNPCENKVIRVTVRRAEAAAWELTPSRRFWYYLRVPNAGEYSYENLSR